MLPGFRRRLPGDGAADRRMNRGLSCHSTRQGEAPDEGEREQFHSEPFYRLDADGGTPDLASGVLLPINVNAEISQIRTGAPG